MASNAAAKTQQRRDFIFNAERGLPAFGMDEAMVKSFDNAIAEMVDLGPAQGSGVTLPTNLDIQRRLFTLKSFQQDSLLGVPEVIEFLEFHKIHGSPRVKIAKLGELLTDTGIGKQLIGLVGAYVSSFEATSLCGELSTAKVADSYSFSVPGVDTTFHLNPSNLLSAIGAVNQKQKMSLADLRTNILSTGTVKKKLNASVKYGKHLPTTPADRAFFVHLVAALGRYLAKEIGCELTTIKFPFSITDLPPFGSKPQAKHPSPVKPVANKSLHKPKLRTQAPV